MGEAEALTDTERRQVVSAFRETLPERFALVVGVGAAATDPTVHAAQSGADLGASALLVAPPPVQDDEVIATYFQRVTQAVPLPVVLHDYPASTGTLLSVGLIARLHAELPTVPSGRYRVAHGPAPSPTLDETTIAHLDRILAHLVAQGYRV